MPKPGQVVRIRISPTDCLGILDILDKAGIPRQNISFSQCTSLALTTLIELARKTDMIPRPDGFDFLNRMEQYIGQGHKGRRQGAADLLYEKTPDISAAFPPVKIPSMPLNEAIEICETLEEKKTKGEKLTEEEQRKYEIAMKVVFEQ